MRLVSGDVGESESDIVCVVVIEIATTSAVSSSTSSSTSSILPICIVFRVVVLVVDVDEWLILQDGPIKLDEEEIDELFGIERAAAFSVEAEEVKPGVLPHKRKHKVNMLLVNFKMSLGDMKDVIRIPTYEGEQLLVHNANMKDQFGKIDCFMMELAEDTGLRGKILCARRQNIQRRGGRRYSRHGHVCNDPGGNHEGREAQRNARAQSGAGQYLQRWDGGGNRNSGWKVMSGLEYGIGTVAVTWKRNGIVGETASVNIIADRVVNFIIIVDHVSGVGVTVGVNNMDIINLCCVFAIDFVHTCVVGLVVRLSSSRSLVIVLNFVVNFIIHHRQLHHYPVVRVAVIIFIGVTSADSSSSRRLHSRRCRSD